MTTGMLFDIFTIYHLPSKTLISRSSVFARCFPASLLPLFMDDFPFCEFRPLYAIGSNRYNFHDPTRARNEPS